MNKGDLMKVLKWFIGLFRAEVYDLIIININDAGLNLLMEFEGCKLISYQDVAGIWTIGVGHTKGVEPGQKISKKMAMRFLSEDVKEHEGYVKQYITEPMNENQFAAFTSLCFNIGPGNFKTSSPCTYFNRRRTDEAGKRFPLWNKARVNGVLEVIPGLVRRRAAEQLLFELAPS